jgi:hypothetical protein
MNMKPRSLKTIYLTALFAIALPGASFAMPGAKAGGMLKGEVLEVLEAGAYVYIKIDAAKGPVWAATPKFDVKAGEKIELSQGMLMANYKSRALDRVFDKVYFTSGPAGKKGHGAKGPKKKPKKDVVVKPVAKAKGAGAKTVSEVYSQKKKLKGKQVRVRGTVVKFSSGILGKNWVHLQDGSGSKDKGTHDILATTSKEFEVGEVVTIKGLVALDRDFGSGYKYGVLIEKAFREGEKKPAKKKAKK